MRHVHTPPRRAVLTAAGPPSPRVRQLAEALAEAGYDVASAPDPAAAVVLWTDPASRLLPLTGTGTAHVLDVHGIRRPDPALCAGADLVLTGSEASGGAWAEALRAAGMAIPVAVMPYAPALHAQEPVGFGTLSILPGAGNLGLLERAVAWAGARGVAVRLASGLPGPDGLLAEQALREAGSVAAMPGQVMLDLSGGPGMPDAAADALARGIPVLCGTESPFGSRLDAAGAGGVADPLEAKLDEVAALPAAALRAMAAAARGLAADGAAAGRALAGALGRAEARARGRAAAWRSVEPGRHPLGRDGWVLVISDEAPNLVDIRVHLPLGTLHRRGVIGGYAVLRHGEVTFSTGPLSPDSRFDALVVHRSVDAGVQLLAKALGRAFIYDVDDNLLASPSYRESFPAETIAAAQALLRECAVLSCATPLLLQLLQRRGGFALAGKTVVTPNIAEGAPAVREPGAPRAVIWASSDQPALTGSRREMERAVRDFCVTHRLPLVCIGAAPSRTFKDPGLAVEHVGLLSYAAYVDRLRATAPAILVCPLETEADPQTQDFVDGKSDVKVIEAMLTGLTGVFSRARPYTDSDLGPRILCDNTYESWLAGLEAARGACLEPGPAAPWPEHRAAAQLGPAPWAEALARARLPDGPTLGEVLDGVAFVQQQQAALLEAPGEFDEGFYLGKHEDVRQAKEAGLIASGFEHYRAVGKSERRAARKRPSARNDAEAWWALLMRTTGRLQAESDSRGRSIHALQERLKLRRTTSPPQAVPAAEPAPAETAVVWHPPGAQVAQPCPVCDAPGPHPVLLQTEGHTLARCGPCGTCFYEHRAMYDYELETDATVLMQLYLEQNAGIHHQTRLLFTLDDPAIDSVLDVGCGFGYPVDMAAKVLGWRATGLDPSFYAREGRALLQADVRKAYLEEDTRFEAPFSLVMASEVIEHVPDPYAFITLLRRCMKPGGTLVLTTPDAGALSPDLGPGSLIGILALRVHLILFSRDSLELALRRAGFPHVEVRAELDGLTAYASDRPLRFRPDAAMRHMEAYLAYLRHLLDTAEPGSALWNGAAGRLFTIQAPDAPVEQMHELFGRITAAWQQRFDIDVSTHRLPELLPERAFLEPGGASPARLAASQPLNLATVLFNRAVLEFRMPGRSPAEVVAFARRAYRVAVQTRRVLQTANMIDLDLKMTAWRARQLIIDCLAELAPEVEGELLAALAQPSPPGLHDWVDPPGAAMTNRAAPFFTRMVQQDRFDEARRVEPWVGDPDALCAAMAGNAGGLFHALFTLGVLRLVGDRAPAEALAVFQRLEEEARRRLQDPSQIGLAEHFIGVAQEHVRLAESQMGV